jgi:hypothetical protein
VNPQLLCDAADVDLGAKAPAEVQGRGRGIVAQIGEFAKVYCEVGLPVCRRVDQATAALRGRLDAVEQWIRTGEGERRQSSVAHKEYVRFCDASKREPLNPMEFKAGRERRSRRPPGHSQLLLRHVTDPRLRLATARRQNCRRRDANWHSNQRVSIQ